MASDDDELLQLREEQRRRLADDIRKLNDTMQQIQKDIQGMRENFAKSSEIASLNARISVLEEGKAKVIGGFVALSSLQVLSGILVYLVQHAPTK